jgi:hypothetical protein
MKHHTDSILYRLVHRTDWLMVGMLSFIGGLFLAMILFGMAWIPRAHG